MRILCCFYPQNNSNRLGLLESALSDRDALIQALQSQADQSKYVSAARYHSIGRSDWRVCGWCGAELRCRR